MVIEKSTIKKCLRGNQEAYKEVYNSTVPYVLSIVRRYIYDDSKRPDAVQDIYIQLFNNLNKYDSKRGEFKSFLRTLSVNCCLSIIRKQSKKPFIQTLSVVEENTVSDQSEEKITELTKEDILKLLEKMPEGYKLVFVLFAIDGYSHKEIAEKLNISSETSRSQYSRAKKWILKSYNNSTIKRLYGIF